MPRKIWRDAVAITHHNIIKISHRHQFIKVLLAGYAASPEDIGTASHQGSVAFRNEICPSRESNVIVSSPP